MTTRVSFRKIAVVAVGGIFVVSLGGIAQAVTSNVFRYSATKTGYYVASAFVFSPLNSTATYEIDSGDSALSSSGANCFVGGINLPNGATITGATVWYKTIGGEPSVQLLTHRLSDGLAFNLGSRTFADDTNTRKAGNITVPAGQVVNNAAFSYGAYVCLNSSDVFYALRIRYTYDNAGD
jgi:hypothetical protein